jgi:hypothetical protein
MAKSVGWLELVFPLIVGMKWGLQCPRETKTFAGGAARHSSTRSAEREVRTVALSTLA